jgi:hypothetical protein
MEKSRIRNPEKTSGSATLVDSLYFGLHVVMISCLFLSSSYLSGGSFPLLIPSCGSFLHLIFLLGSAPLSFPSKVLSPLSFLYVALPPFPFLYESLSPLYSLDILWIFFAALVFPNLALLVPLFSSNFFPLLLLTRPSHLFE